MIPTRTEDANLPKLPKTTNATQTTLSPISDLARRAYARRLAEAAMPRTDAHRTATEALKTRIVAGIEPEILTPDEFLQRVGS